jgi:hypothetical protein
MNGPTNVSPARRRMVSPGAAASIAAWSFVYVHPLAHTRRVAADATWGIAKQTRHRTTLDIRLRRTGTLPTLGIMDDVENGRVVGKRPATKLKCRELRDYCSIQSSRASFLFTDTTELFVIFSAHHALVAVFT